MRVNGEFYIDNVTANFWLYEKGGVDLKGSLARANIFGLWTAPFYPFTAAQVFGLAPSDRIINYSPEFSLPYSSVKCANRPVNPCTISFAFDLAGFLAYGDSRICTASFDAGSDEATLDFNTISAPAGVPYWAIMPIEADINFAGITALIGGAP